LAQGSSPMREEKNHRIERETKREKKKKKKKKDYHFGGSARMLWPRDPPLLGEEENHGIECETKGEKKWEFLLGR
jgi:hypothetical protein